ncbi:DNA (cytosine-5-)-methyltransferase [Streptomyces sp. NPDC050738]|uniref:DNA cytosine methyltransferase n=1 Tax=Streptomyces sp. NPDC050738 TaxID=3154744 RepID=UPI003446B35B
MPIPDAPAIASLCSGVGGLDLGVLAALGGHIAWHAETDEAASRVLAHHWPNTPNYGDLRTIDWSRVPPVDVICAGFPCQDLSVAGPRTGLAPGGRSGVWHNIVAAIRELHPKVVVIENVRGILSTPAGTHPTTNAVRDLESCPRCLGDLPSLPRMRALGAVLGSLADLGYRSSWAVVRASDVGAPHQRARVVLAAHPHETPPAEDSDREPRDERRHSAPRETQEGRPRPHSGRRDRAPAAHPASERRHQGLSEPVLPQRLTHPCRHRSDSERLRGPGAAAAHPDANGGAGTTPKRKGGMNLRTAVTLLPDGGPTTSPPSAAGNTQPATPHPPPPSPAPDDSPPNSSNGCSCPLDG